MVDRKSRGGDGKRKDSNNKVERRDQSKAIKKAPKGQKQIKVESLRKERDQDKGGKLNKGGKGGKKTLMLGKKGGQGGNANADGGNSKKAELRRKKLLGKKKGGRFNKKGGKPLPKDAEGRADALDKELESYWVKGGHQELGKFDSSPLI